MEQFSCARVQEYYSFGEKLFTSLMSAFESDTNIFECVGNLVTQAGEVFEDMTM